MGSERSLREAWDDNAADWVRWARSPELDHAFWRLNLPAMLDLLPAPRGATLDVGCGEGRLARELKRRGYEVVGLESSPALADAAREADPELTVHLADAAAMPLPDGGFELAVASLSLMNMDDMPAVVREVARVLKGGGRFCFSVLHPVNTWGDAETRSYFEAAEYEERIEEPGGAMTFHDTHRPLSAYFDALAAAGFAVEALREPTPGDTHVAAHPAAARWRDRPAFLHVRALVQTGVSRGAAAG
jgi:SAM-dependent methyltransferase